MINSRAARKSELVDLARLQHAIFRPHEPGIQRYLSYVFEDPTYTVDQTRVLERSGEIISHLRVWSRTLQMGCGPVRAGGIGSLLTVPHHRGRGYGGLLLKETEEYLKSEGYRLAFLFSSIGTAYYEHRGWHCVPLPQLRFDLMSSEFNPVTGQALVRHLGPDDLSRVAELYRLEIDGLIGPEVRSVNYWLSGPSRQRGVFPNWGIEIEGSLAGYLHLTEMKGYLHLVEAALTPEAVEPAVEFILSEVQRTGAGAIVVDLPYRHPVSEELHKRLAVKARVRMRLREELLVKILDRSLAGSPERPIDEAVRWLFRLVHFRESRITEEAFAASGFWKTQSGYYWRRDAF